MPKYKSGNGIASPELSEAFTMPVCAHAKHNIPVFGVYEAPRMTAQCTYYLARKQANWCIVAKCFMWSSIFSRCFRSVVSNWRIYPANDCVQCTAYSGSRTQMKNNSMKTGNQFSDFTGFYISSHSLLEQIFLPYTQWMIWFWAHFSLHSTVNKCHTKPRRKGNWQKE